MGTRQETALTGNRINLFRMKTILKGIELEELGMKRRGRSCYRIAKEEFGITGSRKKVIEMMKCLIIAEEWGKVEA